MSVAATIPLHGRPERLLVALAAVALGACGIHLRPRTTPSPSANADIVITQEQIAALNVRTAWDVVKRRAPQLSYAENGAGQPQRMWRHGPGSLLLDETPLLFVDGTRVSDISALAQIPATDVSVIRILTGLAATTEYGTNAADGAILVETKRGT